jgi:uncharacterized membrane protein
VVKRPATARLCHLGLVNAELAKRIMAPSFGKTTLGREMRDHVTESRARSALKAVSWRVLGSTVTMVGAYALSRRFSVSIGVAGIEFVAKTGMFWLHERIWNRVQFGRINADTVNRSPRRRWSSADRRTSPLLIGASAPSEHRRSEDIPQELTLPGYG